MTMRPTPETIEALWQQAIEKGWCTAEEALHLAHEFDAIAERELRGDITPDEALELICDYARFSTCRGLTTYTVPWCEDLHDEMPGPLIWSIQAVRELCQQTGFITGAEFLPMFMQYTDLEEDLAMLAIEMAIRVGAVGGLLKECDDRFVN